MRLHTTPLLLLCHSFRYVYKSWYRVRVCNMETCFLIFFPGKYHFHHLHSSSRELSSASTYMALTLVRMSFSKSKALVDIFHVKRSAESIQVGINSLIYTKPSLQHCACVQRCESSPVHAHQRSHLHVFAFKSTPYK